MDESVIAACSTVFSLGIDGNEHLIALRDDRVILQKSGNATSVDLAKEINAGILDKVDVLIHNHPNYSSLSAVDLSCARGLDCEIIAVTPDNSVYAARTKTDHIIETRRTVWNYFCGAFSTAFEQGRISQDEAVCALGHYVNTVLDKEGLIKYRYVLNTRTKLIHEKAWCLGCLPLEI